MKEDLGLTFKAHFVRASTTVDGAIRISLDLSPHEAQVMVHLLSLKDRVFHVAMIPEPKDEASRGPW